MTDAQFIADLERALTDLGKQHEEVLARFEEFVDGILPVQIPPLRFHPWTRRPGQIAFEFRGMHYLLRHLHVVHESKEFSMIELPQSASDKLVRDVTENCRTLKFDDYGFEET
jgi:hypothetical protein